MAFNESDELFTLWLGFINSTKDEDPTSRIYLTISLGTCMVLSIIGNVCTFIVIVRNRYMWTPTNCYLVNLAVTDLLTALFIPLELYLIWVPQYFPFGEGVCRFHYALWDCISNCSLLIITAFTIERYRVVKNPFLRQKLTLNSRVYKIIGIAWLVSFCFCLPYLFQIKFFERNDYVYCYFTQSASVSAFVYAQILVFFFLPMITIFVLYFLISIELKSKKNNIRGSSMKGKHKAIKLLATIAGTSFFFWTPYVIFRVMLINPIIKFEENPTLWKVISYLVYNGYMSTAANPILYNLMSSKFRQAFKDLMNGRRTSRAYESTRLKPNTHQSETYTETCAEHNI